MSARPLGERLRALLDRLAAGTEGEALAAEVDELVRELAALREVALGASRLAEKARTAAALNHELRQPVLAVRALAEFIAQDQGDGPAIKGHAHQIHEQSDRMVRLLRCFEPAPMTPPAAGHETADVAEVARDVASLVGYRLQRRVVLDLDLAPDLPRVSGGPDRLEQILLNLVVNAIDAVEERGGRGGVILRARPAAGRGEVEILVADEGIGVPADARARLFEPYFTTKDPDRGTGLGLVICAELARAMGGRVELCDDDELARLGPWSRQVCTLFRVRLPAARGGG